MSSKKSTSRKPYTEGKRRPPYDGKRKPPSDGPVDYCVPLDYLASPKIPKDFVFYITQGCLSSIFTKKGFDMTILVPKTTAFLKGKTKGSLSDTIRFMALYKKYDKTSLHEMDGKTISSYGGPLLVEKGGEIIGGIKVDLKPIISKEHFNIFSTEGKPMKRSTMRIDGGDFDIPELIGGGKKKKKITKKKPTKKKTTKRGGGYDVSSYDGNPVIDGIVAKTMDAIKKGGGGTIKGGVRTIGFMNVSGTSLSKLEQQQSSLTDYTDYGLRRHAYDMVASQPNFGNYTSSRPSWADDLYANLICFIHDNYPAKLLEKSGIMHYDPVLGLEKLIQWKSGINTDVNYELSDPIIRQFFQTSAFDTDPTKIGKALEIFKGIGGANILLQSGLSAPKSVHRFLGGSGRYIAIQDGESIFEMHVKNFRDINEFIDKLEKKELGMTADQFRSTVFQHVYEIYKKNTTPVPDEDGAITVKYELEKRIDIGDVGVLDKAILKKINGDLKTFLHQQLEKSRKGDSSDSVIEARELALYESDEELGAINLIFGDNILDFNADMYSYSPFLGYSQPFYGGEHDDIRHFKQNMNEWIKKSRTFLWEGNLGMILSLYGDKNPEAMVEKNDFDNALKLATRPPEALISSAQVILNMAVRQI